MSPSILGTWINAQTDGRLLQFTVYRHPLDYPHHYVIRAWYTVPKSVELEQGPAWTFDTLDAARLAIPQDMVVFARAPGDDPTIVETYI